MKSFRTFVRRLSIVAAATTLGTAAVVALSATPAYATFPTLAGTHVCDTSTGNWVVTWTVSNTWPQTGRITSVGVTPDGTSLTGGIVVGTSLAQGASVTGQQIVTPGTASFARLTVTVLFSNRHESTKSEKEYFEGGCEQDKPKYEATSASDCDSISVTVENTGKIEITGTVTSGNESKPFTLAPNATSEPFEFPGGDGVTATVAVQGAEPTTFTWEKPEDCPTPTTPPPTTTTPPLPVTGASLTTLVGVGGALVLVGGALLMVLRFRRRLGES